MCGMFAIRKANAKEQDLVGVFCGKEICSFALNFAALLTLRITYVLFTFRRFLVYLAVSSVIALRKIYG
jgi:hypothetical protein